MKKHRLVGRCTWKPRQCGSSRQREQHSAGLCTLVATSPYASVCSAGMDVRAWCAKGRHAAESGYVGGGGGDG